MAEKTEKIIRRRLKLYNLKDGVEPVQDVFHPITDTVAVLHKGEQLKTFLDKNIHDQKVLSAGAFKSLAESNSLDANTTYFIY